MTEAFGNEAETLVPRVYGASELGVLAVTAPGEVHPRVEYVGGELFVGLDREGVAITRGESEAWSRPFGETVAAALQSVSPLPSPVEGVVTVTDEVTAAAVLSDPARVTGVPVTGAPVVFALARTELLIVGADDEEAFVRVLDRAEELYDAGGNLVSAHPITPKDGSWAPFAWAERIPALEKRIQRVLRLFSVRAYEAQTVALQRPDVHVADPKLQILDSGVTTTVAAWPKGTATLLPVVDNVIIADNSDGVAKLSVTTLNEFLDAAGDAVIRTGLSPARYFIPGEPPR